MKLMKWLIPVLVLASMPLLATAVSAQEVERNGIVGEVTSASIDESGAGTLVILTKDGDEVTVQLAAGAYELKTPGEPTPTQVADVLAVGAQVAVLLQDGNAVQVLVKPQRPVAPPVTGAVVSIEDGVLTIAPPNGPTRTIQLPPQATPPSIGELVTAFVPDATATDDDPDGAGRPPVATGFVRAAEVSKRLGRFLDEALSEPTGSDDEERGRGIRVEDLAALLEQHSNEHVEVLTGLLAREDFPAQGKAGIARALENAERGRSEARAQAQAARERRGRPDGSQAPADRGNAGSQAPEDGLAQGCPDGDDPSTTEQCPDENGGGRPGASGSGGGPGASGNAGQ